MQILVRRPVMVVGPSELLRDVLRVQREPFDYVDEWAVHGALTRDPRRYVAFVAARLREAAEGAATIAQPPKQIFVDARRGGDFRVMPCVVERARDVTKTVKIVGTNVAQSRVTDQITVGKAFALDAHDNFVTHVFEACLLSSARTGACAAIALAHLGAGGRAAARLRVVGAGRVGYYVALYAAAFAGFREVAFADLDVARATRAASAIAEATAGEVRTTAHDARDARAVTDEDAVVLATTARAPVLEPEGTSARVVVSVGADTEDQRELGDGFPRVSDVYVDTLDGLAVGDLRAWTGAALLAPADVTGLLELVARGPRESARRRVFVSTGSALFDNLTIQYLLAERQPPRE